MDPLVSYYCFDGRIRQGEKKGRRRGRLAAGRGAQVAGDADLRRRKEQDEGRGFLRLVFVKGSREGERGFSGDGGVGRESSRRSAVGWMWMEARMETTSPTKLTFTNPKLPTQCNVYVTSNQSILYPVVIKGKKQERKAIGLQDYKWGTTLKRRR
ncbi:hypothetical protein L6452_36858 [Arctium lappa]|uniref:Uncharacterized protein n=1 Tax=Arctium lappa TaxID=4217 RepID=A0ACB8Y252_ARCLA|nr:hypothetical protein L6452_36858 [Arctium lappa]